MDERLRCSCGHYMDQIAAIPGSIYYRCNNCGNEQHPAENIHVTSEAFSIDYDADLQERMDELAQATTDNRLLKLEEIRIDCNKFTCTFVDEDGKQMSLGELAILFKEYTVFLLEYAVELEHKNMKLAEKNVLKAIRGIYEYNEAIAALKVIRDDHNDGRSFTGATAAHYQNVAADVLNRLGETK